MLLIALGAKSAIQIVEVARDVARRSSKPPSKPPARASDPS